jgi:hypothetical protein
MPDSPLDVSRDGERSGKVPDALNGFEDVPEKLRDAQRLGHAGTASARMCRSMLSVSCPRSIELRTRALPAR